MLTVQVTSSAGKELRDFRILMGVQIIKLRTRN